MTPDRRPTRRIGSAGTFALVFLIVAPMAGEALAEAWATARPSARIEKPTRSYAGDCGPNPPPGYRHDLKNWRSGFNRDFYCYMLDDY